ncbi:flavin reductase family protein [Erysipelothrix tonsillarum]|uniref:flavin reductase family protein n=1 Tax=Erysipelothrix tonsillarum TaxID=38402 RepID=UPI00037245FC|nr:flavin reductase family protein [Erysipelothrix tonsillarum]
MKFKIENLDSKARYKLLTGSVVPRPIAWVTTTNTNGTVNLAPFSYFSLISTEVPIVSIAINRINHQLKDTSKNILESKACVIHVVDDTLVASMNSSSATLPYGDSELNALSLKVQPSEVLGLPCISDAKIKMEATLYSHQVIEDEKQIHTDLFLLKIVHIEIDDSVYDLEKGYIKTNVLHPVARLAGNEYAGIKPVFTIKRPK